MKGYEYAKGQYVVVTDEDFEKARVPATQTFDIRAFDLLARSLICTSTSCTISSPTARRVSKHMPSFVMR